MIEISRPMAISRVLFGLVLIAVAITGGYNLKFDPLNLHPIFMIVISIFIFGTILVIIGGFNLFKREG